MGLVNKYFPFYPELENKIQLGGVGSEEYGTLFFKTGKISPKIVLLNISLHHFPLFASPISACLNKKTEGIYNYKCISVLSY